MDHIDINYIEANIEEPNYVDINYTEANMEENSLYEGKKFSSWIICDSFLDKWSKSREGKYPLQSIYSKNLYTAIRKFRPIKALLNDTATMSNWIDKQKKEDSRWIVARDWDDDNTLTRLFWMTPSQVENWIQYSDCILNDVMHKTN
ncbi:571_t:CDS:2, partial [Gigaspora rosea]